jgi:hypothetical protein
VRPALIDAFLRAFYMALWRGAATNWEVLDGDHAEKAVVNVVPEEATQELPLFVPYCFGEQVFVNHPQAFKIVMEHVFRFVQKHFSQIDRVQYFAEVEILAGRHTSATLGHLAQGLSIYTLTVRKNGESKVEQVGLVA